MISIHATSGIMKLSSWNYLMAVFKTTIKTNYSKMLRNLKLIINANVLNKTESLFWNRLVSIRNSFYWFHLFYSIRICIIMRHLLCLPNICRNLNVCAAVLHEHVLRCQCSAIRKWNMVSSPIFDFGPKQPRISGLELLSRSRASM